MDFLQTISIYPGMRKEKIDCFQVNKVLREQYPEIVWVSTSLDGSILQIKIKENEMRRNNVPSLEDAEGIDLIATCDGVITQIITRKGILSIRNWQNPPFFLPGNLQIQVFFYIFIPDTCSEEPQ